MKVTNWKRKLAATLVAAGVWLGGAHAHAELISHFIGDSGFDNTDVNASTYTNYAYTDSGHVSAWEDPGTTSPGYFGNWWYNTEYAQSDSPGGGCACFRPTPRTGNQALHGGAGYTWQDLGDTFEAGRTYTLTMYASGDSDETGTGDRVWMYLYDGTDRPDLSTTFFDPDSLVSAFYDRDGTFDVFTGTATGSNEGWVVANGGVSNEWGAISLTYKATADVAGNPIGIAMYGRGNAAMDDVTLTSVPEPSAAILFGLGGMAGLMALRRRNPG